ncbi:MAG TPA: ATP-dependent helicase, partial [Ignavibacteriales bacterium]|nr:ATP-dependent helicase [Ignavibacteriales bacterium]
MIKKYKLTKLGDIDKPVSQHDESKFLIDYRNLLNPAQFEAVSSIEGAYLLIAGAGTGKTRTLVFRVARLIELGYDPKSIILLTFTRKAAREMLNRASLLLDNRCSKISGGTFHSFANITLRKYAKAVGLESNFTILDQGDSEDVINLIRSQLNLSAVKKRFPHKQTLNKIYSLSVNTQKSVDKIVYDEYPHFYEFIEPILKIQTAYQNYKAKNSLVDY